MQTIHIIVLIGGVWLLLGLFFWALIHGGKDTQADIEEPGSYGYTDQDGESVPGIHDLKRSQKCHPLVTGYQSFGDGGDYDPDAWKHASVKVPHADSSAATFHRAE